MNISKIVIGCDHAALELKAKVIAHLKEQNIEVTDVGTYTSDSCNYPDYASALCKKIQSGEFTLGILICGTGIGMSMAANKHNGPRKVPKTRTGGPKTAGSSAKRRRG